MYDKQYYDTRKQEIQNENIKVVLEAYDDVLRIMQKSIAKNQELNAKFQKVAEEEKASMEAGKKAVEPAETEKKP